ncbi:hypothetical protein [Massilia phosphatilytica]
MNDMQDEHGQHQHHPVRPDVVDQHDARTSPATASTLDTRTQALYCGVQSLSWNVGPIVASRLPRLYLSGACTGPEGVRAGLDGRVARDLCSSSPASS